MEVHLIKISTIKLEYLLREYLEKIEKEIPYRHEKIFSKYTQIMCKEILKNISFTVFVRKNKIIPFISTPNSMHIEFIDEIERICKFLYIFRRTGKPENDAYIMVKPFENDFSKNVNAISSYIECYIRLGGNNKTINPNLLENIVLEKEEKKKYIKGAKATFFGPLFNCHRKNTFQVYKSDGNKFIPYSKLKSYLDLKDKIYYLQCPICNERHIVSKENICQKLPVQNAIITISCAHIKNEKKLDAAIVSVNLKPYVKDQMISNDDLRMLFINNYKYFTKDYKHA